MLSLKVKSEEDSLPAIPAQGGNPLVPYCTGWRSHGDYYMILFACMIS